MGQDMRYPESQHQQSEQGIGQTVEQGRAAEMIETWTNIPGFKGIYQASREGDIRRVYKNGKTRILTPYHKKMSGSQRLVVKLTINGQGREVVVMQVIARTFLGPPPEGHIPVHRNGCQSDNYVNNIKYISRQQAGKIYGARSKRKAVVKIDDHGEIVEVYSSARMAAKANYMSPQTVIDRCNGKRKSPFAPDGYAYAWEDSGKSLEQTIEKIEREKTRSGRKERQ